MKKLSNLTVAAALTVAGITSVNAQDVAAQRNRADVVAEVDMARASGTLDALYGEDSGSAYLLQHASPTAVARSAVRSALRAARSAGEIDVTGEDSGSFALARAATPGTTSHGAAVAELGSAHGRGEPAAVRSDDSGSVHPRHAMPVHWMRYAGPTTHGGIPEQSPQRQA